MRCFLSMRRMNSYFTSLPSLFRVYWLVVGLFVGCWNTSAYSGQEIPDELKDVQIQEHLGSNVSLSDLSFKNELGKDVRLQEYFQRGRPVLLTLVYYGCPNLCNFMLNGLLKTLRSLDWSVGDQFDI